MSINSPANQHTNDEREQKCWDIYVKGISNGIQNAYASAIEAGYSEDHARNITMQGWFKERQQTLVRKEMLSKAERVLDRTLTFEPLDDKGEVKVDLLRVQSDVAKHITKTLGRDEYAERVDVTTKGEPIQTINVIPIHDKD